MTFQFEALPAETFAHLFDLSDADLAARRAVRLEQWNGNAPCRVSLDFAKPGERVILVNYDHLDVASPYAARHAVYVREGAASARPAPGDVPAMLAGYTLALRAFDASGVLVARELVDRDDIEPVLKTLLAGPDVAHVDVHYAAAGCFAARARAV
ncbi:MAG: DUF1203 domain-containing protein [Pseudomonadota bacterium]